MDCHKSNICFILLCTKQEIIQGPKLIQIDVRFYQCVFGVGKSIVPEPFIINTRAFPTVQLKWRRWRNTVRKLPFSFVPHMRVDPYLASSDLIRCYWMEWTFGRATAWNLSAFFYELISDCVGTRCGIKITSCLYNGDVLTNLNYNIF